MANCNRYLAFNLKFLAKIEFLTNALYFTPNSLFLELVRIHPRFVIYLFNSENCNTPAYFIGIEMFFGKILLKFIIQIIKMAFFRYSARLSTFYFLLSTLDFRL